MLDFRSEDTRKLCIKNSNGISNYLISSLIPKNWVDKKYPLSVQILEEFIYEDEFVLQKGIYNVAINTRSTLFAALDADRLISLSDSSINYEVIEWSDIPYSTNIV